MLQLQYLWNDESVALHVIKTLLEVSLVRDNLITFPSTHLVNTVGFGRDMADDPNVNMNCDFYVN